MKTRQMQLTKQAISLILTLALAVGLIPASAAEEDNAQEVWEQTGEAISATSDPMLGVQSGVEDIPADVSAQPRSREELLALDGVKLTEDGELAVVDVSKTGPLTSEELDILFFGNRPMTYSSDPNAPVDKNKNLREQFGLTDAQIEQGTHLHGSRLALTNQLGNLVVDKDAFDLTDVQTKALADLIASGYTNAEALRAVVAKDVFNLSVEQIKSAKVAEIEAALQAGVDEGDENAPVQSGDEAQYLSDKLGLPRELVAQVMEEGPKNGYEMEQAMQRAMDAAYPSDGGIAPLSVGADPTGTFYAPEEILGRPYSYDKQGNFNINVNNGSYSYTETDLSIPGKNGLDLVLTRQYNSDQASTMRTMGWYDSEDDRVAFKVYYRWYIVDGRDQYGNYNFVEEITLRDSYMIPVDECREQAERCAYFTLAQYEDALAYKDALSFDGMFLVYEGNYGHIMTIVPEITTYGDVFLRGSENVEYEDSYLVDEFGLGHGWMLGLSHLRTVNGGYGDIDHPGQHLQLTTSDGTRYNIEPYVGTSGNWIENYYGDDIEFHKCATGEYPNAVYGSYYKDGKTEYFDGDGRNIAIQDRFKNTIKLDYTIGTDHAVEKIKITDTLGNVIVYEEEELDASETYKINRKKYNKLWHLSLNGVSIRDYYSYQQTQTLYSTTSSNGTRHDYNTYPTTLVAVANEAGELTMYTSGISAVRFNSFLQPATREALTPSKTICSNDGYNVLVRMTSVTYPNGSTENISYRANSVQTLGNNGYQHFIQADQVARLNSSDAPCSFYDITYTYGDFDNLEGRAAFEGAYQTVVKNGTYYRFVDENGELTNSYGPWKDHDIVYTFSLDGQNARITKYSYNAMGLRQNSSNTEAAFRPLMQQTFWTAQTTNYTYANELSRWPTEVRTTYGDQTSGKQMTRVEEYTYDTKGNVLTYKKPNGGTETYTYDPNYSIPLTSTFKQNADTTIKVTNTLAEGGKAIAATVTTSNDVQVGKSEFHYNDAGQLTEQKDYRSAAANDYAATTYSYGNGALPIQVAVSGVKTAGSALAASSPGCAKGTVARKQTYNKRGWITSETDAKGNTTSYAYGAAGRITGVTYPNGDTLGYSYSVVGRSVTYTDAAGNQWKCLYGQSGKLRTVTDLTTDQVLQSNTYDRKDRLVKQVIYGNTTPDQTTYYRYDTDGRLIQVERIDENGMVIYEESYTYEDGAGKVTKTISGSSDAPSIVTTSYQDNMGNEVKTGIFRNGTEELDAFAYDHLGNQTQVQTAFSKSRDCITTNSTYDHAGRVLSTADAGGNTTTYTYDWLGYPLSKTAPKDQNTDPNQTKYPTTYAYDVLGRLLEVRVPLASGHTAETEYTYDPNGNMIRELTRTEAKGKSASTRSTDYTYDSMNRLTQVRGNAKQSGQTGADQYQYTNYTYDALGNIKTMSVGDGTNQKTTQYTYDRYSRLTQYRDALGKAENYTYDLNGNLTTKTDRRGVTTTNVYDAMGRLLRSKAGSYDLIFDYTKTGQRYFASSDGQVTTYTYNDAGDLLEEVGPYATKTMTYGVGGVRNSLTVTANGTTYLNNQYDYNKLGYLTKVNSTNVEAHYSYDSNGNVTNITNGNGTTANYSYNKADMVTEIKNKQNKVDLSNFKYTYSADGNQLTKTDKRGTQSIQTSYTYDGLNRLTGESQANVVGAFSAYTYDAYGNRQSKTDGTATITNYTYDAANRLLSTTGGTAATYTYDNQGNMTQMVLTVGDTTRTVNCTYDGFNRLKKFSDNSGETVYTYDADGLRSSKTTRAGTEKYVYDNGQLVAKIADPIEPVEPIFDGSIPNSGEKTALLSLETGRWYYGEINGILYHVQAEDYVIQAELFAVPIGDGTERPEIPGGTVVYTRLVMGDVCFMTDPDTKETTITGPADTRVVLYDSNPNVEQLDDVSYIRGLNLIASRTDEAITYYHYNAHGDVVQLTDATGALIKDYTYDAFGVEQNVAEGDTNPFRYCGEQFDAETGNYYLRARYYTPGTGRFTQADTHWNPGNMIYGDDPQKWNEYRGEDDPLGLHTYTYKPDVTAVTQAGNLYGYGNNNPTAFADPDGEVVLSVAAVSGITITVCVVVSGAVAIAIVNSPKVKEVMSDIVSGIADLFSLRQVIIQYREHDSNQTPSNREKHENGQKRRQLDHGGEKGDKRRTDRSNKRR